MLVTRSLSLLAVFGITVAASGSSNSTPIVDLGYSLHQASLLVSNESNVYYNFSNIRYAAPPTGNLRWRKTELPLKNRTGVQDGSYGRICPNSFTNWQAGAASLLPGAWYESEDCLFLDVVIPKAVYDRKCQNASVPVIVWVHGGGYSLGSKWASTSVGLLDSSLGNESGGAIWVGINYRLGAFGWLNGPKMAAYGTPNAGIYDQRAAFEWVQKFIHLFGGDPTQVTAMGESAGGGSILHHITAYDGVKAPFSKAVMQSPAFVPQPLASHSDSTLEIFLAVANVSTLDQARNLSTTVLQHANKLTQSVSPYGTFLIDISIDGDFVRDLPGKRLLEGKFDKTLQIMAAHNSDEAHKYTNPNTTTDADFNTTMKTYWPLISDSEFAYLTNVLYPPIYDGSQPYLTPFYRLDLAISDFTMTCSTNWLGHAYNNQIYNYMFSAGTGYHIADVVYTYYNGDMTGIVNATTARLMQKSITNFVAKGNPNPVVEGLNWTMYGEESMIANFNATFTSFERDTRTANQRCVWWQKALYAGDYKSGWVASNATGKA